MRKYSLIAAVLILLAFFTTPALAFPSKTDPDYQWFGGFNGTSLRVIDVDLGDDSPEGSMDIVANYVKLSGSRHSIEVRRYDSGTLGNAFQENTGAVSSLAVGNFDTTSNGKDILFVDSPSNPTVYVLPALTWDIKSDVNDITKYLPVPGTEVAIMEGGVIDGSYDDIIIGMTSTIGKESEIYVFRNDGAKYFTRTAELELSTGCEITDAAIGDVGRPDIGLGDGKNDIVAVELCGDLQKIHIFYQKSGGSFERTADEIISFSSDNNTMLNLSTEQKRFSVEIGDVGSAGGHEGDGLNDIIVTNNPDNKVNIYYQLHSGGFPDFTIDTVLEGSYIPTDVAVGDMNGDGYDDIVVASNQVPMVTVYYQPFGPTSSADLTLSGFGGNAPYEVAVGDLNGDGLDDVAALSLSGKCLDWLQENTAPTVDNMSISPSPVEYEGSILFEAGANDSDGLVISYKWESDLDGTFYIGPKKTITDRDMFFQLRPGTHNITVSVQDNGGLWSDELDDELIVYEPSSGYLPELGSPIQILPRFGSVDSDVYVFNVTGPYTPCLLWRENDDVGECTASSVKRTSCTDERYMFEYPPAMFEQSGDYDFNFKNLSGGVSVGEIGIEVSFSPEIRFLSIETTQEVEIKQDSWVKVQLYEIGSCKVTKLGNLTELEPYNEVDNKATKFYTYLAEENLTCGDMASCSLALEVLASDSPDIGGEFYRFTYEPSTSSASLDFSTDDSSYDLDDTAEFTATTSGLGDATVTYNVISPENFTPSSGTLTYNSSADEYQGELDLDEIGTYIINATASSNDVQGLKAYDSISFTVGSGDTITTTISPASLYFGDVGIGKTKILNITVTNPETDDITNFRATRDTSLGSSISAVVSSTTIDGDDSAKVVVTVEPLSSATKQTYTGDITLRGTEMAEETVYVSYTVTEGSGGGGGNGSDPDEFAGTVSPDSWNLNSVMPDSTTDNTFTVDTTTGDTSGISVDVSTDSDVLDFDTETIDVDAGEDEVTATLTATRDPGSYTETIDFMFYENSDLLNTVSVDVTFTIVDSNAQLVDDAWDKHSMLERDLDSLVAKAGAKTSLGKKIEGNVTAAQSYLDDAATTIEDAEMSFADGDDDIGEDLIDTANSDMSRAEDIIDEIDDVVNATSSESDAQMMPLFIVIIVIIAFAFIVLALREGWIPAHKVPWLVKIFKTLGMGPLVEKAEDFSPKPRFAPPTPSAAMTAGPAPTARAAPAAQDESQRRWAEYYKTHPDQANKAREQYRSYYNRRYK